MLWVAETLLGECPCLLGLFYALHRAREGYEEPRGVALQVLKGEGLYLISQK